jgi:hypothetical protein
MVVERELPPPPLPFPSKELEQVFLKEQSLKYGFVERLSRGARAVLVIKQSWNF